MADRGHIHQRWQNHHIPFADQHIDLGIGRGVHHNHLADQEIGLETAEWALDQLTEVQLVEAYHHIEGSKPMEFLGIQGRVHLEGYIPVGIRRSQAGQEPCLYPTGIELAHKVNNSFDQLTLHLSGRPLTL